MQLSVGIVGLPNVGKSTLFNALTKSAVPAENYPFCTIDPSVGIVPVPDRRLETLAALSRSADTIPAVVEFVDIAGLVKGAASGEGLGNSFLANIREVDMIAEVVRIFEDEHVHHVSGAVDPFADIEVINLELILADQQTVAKRKESIARDVTRGEKDAIAEDELLTRALRTLEAGTLLSQETFSEHEKKMLTGLHLLTLKPILYVCNRKQGAFNFDEQNDERWQELVRFFEETGAEYVVVDAGVEHELRDLTDEESEELRRDYGVLESGIKELIRAAYRKLGLISFFTTGEKETRAWTVLAGATGPEAGAAIHSDFRDKYIRAQVVRFEDLVNAGSIAAAREEGKLRTEGKEYVVADGDVIEFLHS